MKSKKKARSPKKTPTQMLNALMSKFDAHQELKKLRHVIYSERSERKEDVRNIGEELDGIVAVKRDFQTFRLNAEHQISQLELKLNSIEHYLREREKKEKEAVSRIHEARESAISLVSNKG